MKKLLEHNNTEYLKNKCIQYRTRDQLSTVEIRKKIKNARALSTLYLWLIDYPLPLEEKKIRASKANRYVVPKHEIEITEFEPHNEAVFSRLNKGNIAEAAVILKLTKMNLKLFAPDSFDSVEDLLIVHPKNKKVIAIQVKWVSKPKKGSPYIKLKKCTGHRNYVKYSENDFDFIIGYDLKADNFYIYSQHEVINNKSTITITKDACNAWHKIHDFDGRIKKQ